MAFVETPRFPDEISQGSSFGPAWRTKINMVNSGYEERLIKWTSQRCEGVVIMENASITEFEEMLDWVYAMQGAGNEFRYKDWGDYRSSSGDTAIAFDDQTIGTGDGSTVAFQLVKKYTKGLTYTRDIKKPVTGTVVVGISGVESNNNFSVNTTTGVVTFDNLTRTITNITQASQAVVSVSPNHDDLFVGDTVYISGVSGMTEINGARYTIVDRPGGNIVLDVDTTGFTAYTSGGTVYEGPQSGETVTAGFEFDVPVRFDTDRMDAAFIDYKAFSFQLPIVEVKL